MCKYSQETIPSLAFIVYYLVSFNFMKFFNVSWLKIPLVLYIHILSFVISPPRGKLLISRTLRAHHLSCLCYLSTKNMSLSLVHIHFLFCPCLGNTEVDIESPILVAPTLSLFLKNTRKHLRQHALCKIKMPV